MKNSVIAISPNNRTEEPDYIVTAWNNAAHAETAYISDLAGCKAYAAYLRRYPKIYSDIRIAAQTETPA